MASIKSKLNDVDSTIIMVDDSGKVVKQEPPKTINKNQSSLKKTQTKTYTGQKISSPFIGTAKNKKTTVELPKTNITATNPKDFQKQANQNYQEKISLFNKASEELDKRRTEELNKRNISQTAPFTDYSQNKLTRQETIKTPLQEQKEYYERVPEVNEATVNEQKNKSKALNDLRYATYLRDVANIANEDPNLYDKTIGQIHRGVANVFSTITDENKYTDENGNVMYLPTRNDLKQQQVQESYGNGFGGDVARFFGNAAYEGGKMLATTALNKVVPFSGTGLYFSDIFADQYKENRNLGYDDATAMTDSFLKTGQNYIKQRLIGGLGGKLTGGDTSWLEKSLTNSWSKLISNPVAVSVLSSMTAEGIDEFTDTFIEAGIDAAVLGKEIDPMELLQEAAYSGGVGAVTGGFGGLDSQSINDAQNAINKNALARQEAAMQKAQQTSKVEQAPTTTETPQIETKQEENTNAQPKVEQQQIDLNETQTESTRSNEEIKQEIKPKKDNETSKIDRNNKAKDIAKNINENNETNALNDIDEIRKYVESQVSPDKRMSKFIETESKASDTINDILNMNPEGITYNKQKHEQTENLANEMIQDKTLDEQFGLAKGILNSDKKMKAEDNRVITKVMKNLLDNGEMEKYRELKSDLAIQLSEAGQFIEATKLVQTFDPLEQLKLLTRIVTKEKKKGNRIYQKVKINPDLVSEVEKTYTKDGFNKEQFETAMGNLKQDIADQMGTTASERINSLRYLSMLGNPKTHIRNVLANKFMGLTQRTKNKIAAVLETGVDKVAKATTGSGIQRTKTLKFTTPEVKTEVSKIADSLYNTDFKNKYDESKGGLKGELESRRNMFGKNKFNEAYKKVSDLNSRKLNEEDVKPAKKMFIETMGNFLTANGIKTKADMDSHKEVVDRAKDYAMFQAKEATFHQESKTGNAIRNARETLRQGSILSQTAGLGLDAAMPFVNTPINIAKTGIEYTPGVGMAKTISDFRKTSPDMKAAVLIDGLSKQFTGLALAGLGMYLRSQGIVTGSGDDDKESKLERDLGVSNYSIRIGDNSFDLSWLSPTAMPLFAGVEFQDMLSKGDIKADPTNFLNVMFSTVNPIVDMSVLDSITSMMQSFASGDKEYVQAFAEKAFTNYLSQFVPTLLGQLAQATDAKQRNYYNGDNVAEKTINQLAYKIPVARWALPEKVNTWGETKKSEGNLLIRAAEAFLSPANRNKITVDDTTRELEKLSKETNDTGVLPTARSRKITINGKEYKLNSNEYTEVQKAYGKTAKKNLDALVNSSEYKNASTEDKKYMIGRIYDYSIYKSKQKYAENSGINYANKDDNNFALVDAFDIPYVDYAKLALNKTSSDKDENGKTISGSKKDKIIDTLNKANMPSTAKQAILNYMNYSYYIDEKAVNKQIDNSSLPSEQKTLLKEAINSKISDNERKQYARVDAIGIDYDLYSKFRTFVSNVKSDKDSSGKTITGSKKKKVINWIQSQKISSEQKKKLYEDYINNQGITTYYR